MSIKRARWLYLTPCRLIGLTIHTQWQPTNNDGFGDIIVPTTQIYDGSIALMQLNNHSIHWQTEGNYDSNIGYVYAADVNMTAMTVLYVDNTTLRVVDAYHQTLLGTGYTLSTILWSVLMIWALSSYRIWCKNKFNVEGLFNKPCHNDTVLWWWIMM